MKKLFTLFAILVITAMSLFAQAPQKFSYQAVVRDAGNNLVTNHPVGIRISILQGDMNGAVVYMETQTTTTNSNGLMTLQIGEGSVVSGDMFTIDWANGPFFLKTEADPTGGASYTIEGTQQLLSVPYALYADRAANTFSGDYNDLSNKPDIPTVPTNVSVFTNDAGYITMDSVPEIPTVPTAVSAFTNDAGYLTRDSIAAESDPTVPAWAKESAKPTYDYSEIQNTPELPTVPTAVSAFTNDAGYLTRDSIAAERDPTVPVWAKESAKPTYDYSEIQNTPELPTVPTAVSAFTNDAGYITMDSVPAIPTEVSAFANDAGYLTRDSIAAESDPTVPAWAKESTKPAYDYSEIQNTPELPTVPTAVSAFTNDAGYITMDSVPAIPTEVSAFANDAGYLTRDSIAAESDPTVPAWAKESTKPAYDYSEIQNTPELPIVPTNVSAFTNDAGYITMDSVPAIPTEVSAFANDAGYITMDSVPVIPTEVSVFTNDAGYLTRDSIAAESDPTVPAWAKESTKPAYDYSEIQNTPELPTVPTAVSAFTNDAGYITMDSVPAIPTDVSAFTNDAGYLTRDSIPAGLEGTQTGDIMYWDAAASTWIMMPAGTSGQVLTMENGVPVWASLPEHVMMNVPPTVTTNVPMEVTQSSALCGGVVTSDGSVQLTACGVCWSTHHFPTIMDSHVASDLSVSAFTSHISNLSHQTTYYVRAYATNYIGTAYGAEMTFTTADIPSDSLIMPDPCSSTDTNAVEQPLFGPNYLMCAGSDSVELTLNNYQYGAIQWQYSTDTISWFDIPGAIDEQLTYKPDQTQFVRAAVSYANCATEYSEVKLLQKTPVAYAGISRTVNYGDTLRLQANMEESATGSWQILQGSNGLLTAPSNAASKFFGTDSLYRLRWTLTNSCGSSSDDINVRYVQTIVSSKVVVVDTTDVIFSDSAQMANGYYIISFSDPNIVIGDSTILVSIVNGGFLRRVGSWEMRDDTTYVMYTSQATLYDVLESGIIQFDAISGSDDAENVIENVPVQNTSTQNTLAQNVMFLDHIPTRTEVRDNPEMDGKLYMLRMDVERIQGISENGNPPSFARGAMSGMNNQTNEHNYGKIEANGSCSLTNGVRLENVQFTMEPAMPILCYFKDNGSLNFGFNNVKLNMEADLVLTDVHSLPEVDLPLVNGTAEAVYYKDGTPIKCDLKYGINCHLTGSADIQGTLRHKLTASVKFTRLHFPHADNSGISNDQPNSHANGITDVELVSDYSQATANVNVSLAAFQNFVLYGVEGPHTTAGYKASVKYCDGSMGWRGNLSSDMFVELDLKGVKDVVDQTLPTTNWSDEHSSDKMNNDEWSNLHKEKTYPYNFRTVGHINEQTISEGWDPLLVRVQVLGSDNKRLRNVSVQFEPKDGGSVSESSVLTDAIGVAQTQWTPGTPIGSDHALQVSVYDCNGRYITDPLTIIAYEPQSVSCVNSTLQLLVKPNNPHVGWLTLESQNGTSPCTYSMDENGLGTNPNCESMTMNMPVAGDHVFKVTDGNGCTCIKHYNPGESSTVDCNWTNLGLAVSRDGDGNVTLEGRNGTPPYQYSEGGYSYGDNNVFTSMSAGNHTFWVKDAAGCQFSREVEVEVDNSVSLGGRPCAGVNTVTDVDGNVYHTLQIGQQCWMAENLRTTHYANGEPIGIGGACFYPDNNSNNKLKFGLLYTWYVTTRDSSSSSNPSGVQGVCPNGWHIPSIAEWDQFLNQPQVQGYPAKTLATKYGWESSTTPGSPGFETYNNNGIEFNASPSGYYSGGNFGFGTMARFWTCKHDWQTKSCAYIMDKDNTGINRNCSCEKAQGYSVRCVRD